MKVADIYYYPRSCVLIAFSYLDKFRKNVSSDKLLVFILCFLFLTYMIIAATDILGILIFVAVLMLYFTPTWILNLFVLPLGLPRVAYWIVRLCKPVNFASDPHMGGMFYGALAMARHGCTPKELDWLNDKLVSQPKTDLNGTGVVTAGILAALKGYKQQARYLFRNADSRFGPYTPRSVKRVARNWLVADAVQHAEWLEVIRLGMRGKDSTLWSYTVARIAERYIGQGQPRHDWQLWALWLIAPRRRLLLPILRRALANPMFMATCSAAENLSAALTRLLHLLQNPRSIIEPVFVQTVQDVDIQLDQPATEHKIRQRLSALGCGSEHNIVVLRFRQQLVELIKPVIEALPHLARGAEDAPSIMQAVEQVRLKLFRDIETCCADYERRSENEHSQENLAERLTWEALKETAEKLLILDPDAEESLFNTMYSPVCNFAVYLHNSVKYIRLAHEMFCWLHVHSFSNSDATTLLEGNIACGQGFT